MRIQVCVTQECIDRGCEKKGDNCPVWHALQPLVNFKAFVAGTFVWTLTFEFVPAVGFNVEMRKAICPLPLEVTRTIEHYDETGRMLPFNFWLDIPDQYLIEQQAKASAAGITPRPVRTLAREAFAV